MWSPPAVLVGGFCLPWLVVLVVVVVVVVVVCGWWWCRASLEKIFIISYLSCLLSCWCGWCWCGWRGGGGCPPPRLGRPSCAPPALSAVRVGAAGSLRGGGRAVAVGGGGGGGGGLSPCGLRPARSACGVFAAAGCARGRKNAAGDILNCYVFVTFLLRFC